MVNIHKMSYLTILFIVILVLAACNNEQKKLIPDKSTDVIAPIQNDSILKIEKSIIKKPKRSYVFRVKEILKTSGRYKQITKGLNRAVIENGGQGFGVCLERSPNPRNDGAMGHSKTYDFVVYEMYTERQLNIAWFSFNPRSKKLYEYDPILDRERQIAFDKNLLK